MSQTAGIESMVIHQSRIVAVFCALLCLSLVALGVWFTFQADHVVDLTAGIATVLLCGIAFPLWTRRAFASDPAVEMTPRGFRIHTGLARVGWTTWSDLERPVSAPWGMTALVFTEPSSAIDRLGGSLDRLYAWVNLRTLGTAVLIPGLGLRTNSGAHLSRGELVAAFEAFVKRYGHRDS